ncbi:tRNA (adenosine(37)-N6)-threonylcarbamoyltransferase complex dimerization subunit type 1 TsaB [Ruania halotolerans]|uniref:tRNA (adenosine(37)-N6)-threonylcarbamoyltransferase complex dimerization subunit type 1 TsaB n=1 Tax=Ruania halotolerans TaxID=2897773 RepID=UPI001E53A164|nr:tRNA (adenosine(37)-N6)-threonylcarbamoyltransferase complex dimerization subunit type 1 TsaB [Ruania halotolerans]UFU05701.1 tRNA (adenosine(37)-N6)-threonylcarbamoyltransferase complex dimerization subunit type 1 TsaB [Ruania halotolerans]
MTLLCLDTSDGAAVAVVRDGATLAAARSADPRRHVETLTPMIVACLTGAEVTPDEITAVAVGTGPAPFTGLRVGLVTARTFALAQGIDVYGVSSLDALADEALDETGGPELLVTTDARRREVYWARYRRTADRDVQQVAGPGVDSAVTVAADHADLVAAGQVLGRGVALYPEPLAPEVSEEERAKRSALIVDPARLGQLAAARAQRGTSQPTDALYLRRPDVHMSPPRRAPMS